MNPTPHTATMRAIGELLIREGFHLQGHAIVREADALDKQQRCDCGQMPRADCDALPSARHCGKFNEATAGVEQSASAAFPALSLVCGHVPRKPDCRFCDEITAPAPPERLEADNDPDHIRRRLNRWWEDESVSPPNVRIIMRDAERCIEALQEQLGGRSTPPQPAAQQSEVVKRLRGFVTASGGIDADPRGILEAADLIERLGAENTNLHAQLAVAQGTLRECRRRVMADGFKVLPLVETIDAALSSHPSPATVLVPVEPTPEMTRAYFAEIDKNMHRVETSATFGRHDNFRLAYKAMLSAAQGK